ncbi:methyltransferase domain-containing protein [Candidatus Coxiella mudrowiae]|uniref:methyltransferase domain-containing protein n=1 Tax=Candidatus Coxiella mudrowiae TaxID=2054173 RepID=UPI00352CBDD5
MLNFGCGTGLCGEYFKPLAKELIGVDLSEKILLIAKNKNIYNILLKINHSKKRLLKIS